MLTLNKICVQSSFLSPMADIGRSGVAGCYKLHSDNKITRHASKIHPYYSRLMHMHYNESRSHSVYVRVYDDTDDLGRYEIVNIDHIPMMIRTFESAGYSVTPWGRNYSATSNSNTVIGTVFFKAANFIFVNATAFAKLLTRRLIYVCRSIYDLQYIITLLVESLKSLHILDSVVYVVHNILQAVVHRLMHYMSFKMDEHFRQSSLYIKMADLGVAGPVNDLDLLLSIQNKNVPFPNAVIEDIFCAHAEFYDSLPVIGNATSLLVSLVIKEFRNLTSRIPNYRIDYDSLIDIADDHYFDGNNNGKYTDLLRVMERNETVTLEQGVRNGILHEIIR